MIAQQRLLDVPLAGLYPVDVAEANELLVRWQHDLGPVNRPFRQEAYAFEVNGKPVSLATSGSIVNGPVAAAYYDRKMKREVVPMPDRPEGFARDEVVELTRLCSSLAWGAHFTRVMLRLWREVCAPAWGGWPVLAAVSYSENARHRGDIYRFDGWTRIRTDAGAGRKPSVWGRRRSDEDYPAAGAKTLWLWRFDLPGGASA